MATNSPGSSIRLQLTGMARQPSSATWPTQRVELDKLGGKRIGLVHLDAPYGKEADTAPTGACSRTTVSNSSSIPSLHRKCKIKARYGLMCGAIGSTGSLQGWGAMNPTALKEAIKIGFPMDRIVGIWWSGSDDDARPAGPEAKGYKSLSITGVGQNYPALQDILKYVVEKGKSQVTAKDKVGEVSITAPFSTRR